MSEPLFLVVDTFCGAGGTSTGFAEAGDIVKVIVGINHNRQAIATFKHHFPDATVFREDIRKVPMDKLLKVVMKWKKKFPHAKLIFWASPDCFVAGTLVLTRRGNIPIEEVRIGDMVLTHKGRWKKVTATMSSLAPTTILRGQGIADIETTVNHPFYAGSLCRRGHYSKRVVEDIGWRKVSELEKGVLLSSPHLVPQLSIPKVGGRGFTFSDEFFWLVGRWLGDGSINRWGDKKQITITCGKHEWRKLSAKLGAFRAVERVQGNSEINFSGRPTQTAYNFEGYHEGLADWLEENFGKGAAGKKMPTWALGMDENYRRALLNGYVSADGSYDGRKYSTCTVSKELGVGVKLLVQALGFGCSLFPVKARQNPIEGRAVKCLPQWRVDWVEKRVQTETLRDDLHCWDKLKSKRATGQIKLVYNISVQEDESYVADGIVNHNCTQHTGAKGGKAKEPDSRTLAWHLDRYFEVLQPDYAQIENVREFKDWGPLDDECQPIKAEKGVFFHAWRYHIRKMGYRDQWEMMNAADYGAHTSRNRLFGCFWKSGLPMGFPKPTHAKNAAKGLKRWEPCREVLNLEDHGKSIFNRYRKNGDPNPLKDSTLIRLLEGLKRHVGKEFLSLYYSKSGTSVGLDLPGPSLTTKDRAGLVTPQFLLKKYTAPHNHQGIDRPGPALTTIPRDNLVTPQFLDIAFTGSTGMSVEAPTGSITTKDHHSLISAFILNPQWKKNAGCKMTDPCFTLIARMDKAPPYLVSAFLFDQNYGGKTRELADPMFTLVASRRHPHLVVTEYGTLAMPVYETDSPAMRTLKEYMAANGIVDIKMRMLIVEELLRIQGFREDYWMAGTATEHKKFIGNSVCPKIPKAWAIKLASMLPLK